MSPVDLSSPLNSGTVFTLTCIVRLVSEVDTTVIVSTTWSKNEIDINSDDRITVDSMAVQDTNITYIYESDIIFDPLSNMTSGGDDGQYTCSALVEDSDYITGSSNDASQNITVEGQ